MCKLKLLYTNPTTSQLASLTEIVLTQMSILLDFPVLLVNFSNTHKSNTQVYSPNLVLKMHFRCNIHVS